MGAAPDPAVCRSRPGGPGVGAPSAVEHAVASAMSQSGTWWAARAATKAAIGGRSAGPGDPARPKASPIRAHRVDGMPTRSTTVRAVQAGRWGMGLSNPTSMATGDPRTDVARGQRWRVRTRGYAAHVAPDRRRSVAADPATLEGRHVSGERQEALVHRQSAERCQAPQERQQGGIGASGDGREGARRRHSTGRGPSTRRPRIAGRRFPTREPDPEGASTRSSRATSPGDGQWFATSPRRALHHDAGALPANVTGFYLRHLHGRGRRPASAAMTSTSRTSVRLSC